MSSNINDQLVLISGESSSGKSASLMNLPGGKRNLYLNCESGKRLPFPNQFDAKTITDPYQVIEAFQYTQDQGAGQYDRIIIDTLTFLMDMYESQYVLGQRDTMAGWSNYQQYFKELMQVHVASSQLEVIFLAHTRTEQNEKLESQTAVPVKGALKNNGVEAYFSTVVSTKKVPLTVLKDYQNSLLNITEDDELVGYKHVFQTRLTKATVGERIRSPMGLFTKEQTYMDNDAHLLLEHLRTYYGTSAAA